MSLKGRSLKLSVWNLSEKRRVYAPSTLCEYQTSLEDIYYRVRIWLEDKRYEGLFQISLSDNNDNGYYVQKNIRVFKK